MTVHSIKDAFEAFRDQCIWLQDCYSTYAALFESDEATGNLLRCAAPAFFGTLNVVLIEYCLLQMCRLTDPASVSPKGENLTVQNLNAHLEAAGLMTQGIRDASAAVLRYRKIVVDARNKIISHADKETVLTGRQLGAHEAADVDAFFANLYKYTDAVGEATGAGPLDYRVASGPGDALDLLRVLRAGLV